MAERESPEPGYADVVRAAREATGMDLGELAAALNVSFESYRDIETYDDEITTSVSFANLVTLGELLDLDLRRMFGADDAVMSFGELAAAVRTRLATTTLDQLENDLGWELAEALDNPSAFAEFSVDGLADVAGPLGLDWRHLLPPSRLVGHG
jgi:transcriptional regulator with XRE-family HTH domain